MITPAFPFGLLQEFEESFCSTVIHTVEEIDNFLHALLLRLATAVDSAITFLQFLDKVATLFFSAQRSELFLWVPSPKVRIRAGIKLRLRLRLRLTFPRRGRRFRFRHPTTLFELHTFNCSSFIEVLVGRGNDE
jgi:hypothetical protein